MAKKGKLPWLLIGVVAAGIYFVFRRRGQTDQDRADQHQWFVGGYAENLVDGGIWKVTDKTLTGTIYYYVLELDGQTERMSETALNKYFKPKLYTGLV